MLIKHSPAIRSSEITPKKLYLNRRHFIGAAAAFALASPAQAGLVFKPKAFVTDEKLTPLQHVTAYNNYYEFGTDKADPAANAGTLKTAPWTVKIDGLVNKPGTYALEDLLKWADLEERIYRMRCVEGWSMVIPWVGTPLAAILNHVEPTSAAKYVAFETLVRPEEMPGQSGLFQPLNWPYVEGLRLDEAMNPLTILASGLYGEPLPNQNGAPLRLVVPWKYGFKGIKSIVRISLTDKEPASTWNQTNASEYGFYSNVNPEVDHPRWSQATERRIGEGGLFADPVKTLKFNGYGEQVASLYANMDLRKDF